MQKRKLKTGSLKDSILSAAELESIINSSLAGDMPNLVKDMFLFSRFTGPAYTDMCNLTGENIVINNKI